MDVDRWPELTNLFLKQVTDLLFGESHCDFVNGKVHVPVILLGFFGFAIFSRGLLGIGLALA